MKKTLTILFLTGFVSLGFSQTATKKTIDKSCDCLNKSKVNVTNYDDYIGLITTCVSTEILANFDQLKVELGINESDYVKAMEKVGEKLGEKMMLDCPSFAKMTVNLISSDDQQSKDLVREAVEKRSASIPEVIEEGKITAVSDNFPTAITVQTRSGESIVVLLLDKITLQEEYLKMPSKLKGKNITIVYTVKELYDVSYKKFTPKKVLVELNVK